MLGCSSSRCNVELLTKFFIYDFSSVRLVGGDSSSTELASDFCEGMPSWSAVESRSCVRNQLWQVKLRGRGIHNDWEEDEE